ncbi:MAG TPA: dihydrolipoamide acetyltransferase family protein, partial [Gemmataceae bacterium]|nr:dihydrolipoamide acetyltransferase family protein [Gemmataceae bacterium]
MATEIKLPQLGEGLESGEVLSVKVQPGQTVAEGQALLEIEAEKATVEVPAPMSGRVVQMKVKKGDMVRVGQVYCAIEPTDGREEKAEAPPEAEARPEPEQSDGRRRPATAEAEPKPAPAREAPPPAAAPDTGKPVLAGPATRRLARELGIDLRQVPGSGRHGRVSQDDIRAYVRRLASGAAGVAAAAVPAPPLPDFERWGPVERRPFESVRKKTAEQMSLAWAQIPHVTQHDLADITDLDAFRRQQEGKGPKLTITAFALKAAAIALTQFPQFNASLDTAQGQLIVKRYYHIGVAVDTERGLLVPVIRDVDKKSVQELAQELTELAERARQKKVTADDMRGGTFTITNLGGIGGTGFTPIVNYPEVAILGMSRGRWTPVVHNGQVVPRLLLPLSLSYDHRVIDGADAARFTRRIAEMLENP